MQTSTIKPINSRSLLTPQQIAFLSGEVTFRHTNGRLRLTVRMNLLMHTFATARRRGSDETILEGFTRNSFTKLHDGEPEIINAILAARCPEFWSGCPQAPTSRPDRQKAFIGQALKHMCGGLVQYAKPNLRRVAEPKVKMAEFC